MFFRRDSRRARPARRHLKLRGRRAGRRHSFDRRLMVCEPLEARQLLATFEAMGPASAIHGRTEKVSPDNEVSGALHTVLTHPTNADVMYVGSVNGGIWRTNNATAARPHWVPLTDHLPSLSIGAMAMDPNNPQRIVAGTGRYSAMAEGGLLGRIVLTENGGASWQVISDPLMLGKNISGIAIDGDRILVSAGGGFFSTDPAPSSGGLFRSTDGGATWENLEIFPRDANFPEEAVPFEVFDLVADPTDPQRFYAGVADAGIYRTDDGGTNWSSASAGDPRIDNFFQVVETNGLDHNNIEMAVASNGRIYAAFIANGQPLFFGYSDSFGGSWTEMDIPLTEETTGAVGISPNPKPGGQGNIHFSIIADPNDPFTVYVGGDRQDGDLSFQSGNSIGARDFTGKLFRGDTRRASIGNVMDPAGVIPFLGYSPQWEHLTHSNLVPEMPEGGTRRGSAPHADSREVAFDANGNLIQVDDGGIYRRTSPRTNQGDWFSVNGDLQVTEIHNIAYDSNGNVLVGGTQDNGVVQQPSPSAKRWEVIEVINQSISGVVIRSTPGDGGDIAIDDTSIPGHSIRYFSAQDFTAVRRQVYDARNNLISEDLLTPNFIGNFITPVVLNEVNRSRLAVGGAFGIFESFDRGNSFREIRGPGNTSFGVIGPAQLALEYGGWRSGQSNPAVLYVGSDGEVFVRTDQNSNLRLTRAQFPGGYIWDIALDSADWTNAYVIDQDDVYLTTNIGDSWRRVTGNLRAVGGGRLRTVEFVRRGGEAFVVVGTDSGVFVTSHSSPGQWTELGKLPHAPVMDLEYDATDNVLAVGTLGRGAFLMRNAFEAVRGVGAGGQQSFARGVVWNDLDGDGTRDANEPGLANVKVYVDLNGDNLLGVTEPAAITTANGSFAIGKVPSGNFAVRVVVDPGWVQTAPSGNGEHIVNFTNIAQAANLNFGLREGDAAEMGFDFGDAPASYATLFAADGASHGIVPGFQLGQRVDGDLNGRPSPAADGDDNHNEDDEDGVTFVSDVIPGAESTVQVVVQTGSQPPGLLQAWIDFDGDGTFNTPGEQIFRDVAVGEGTHVLRFPVPSWARIGQTVARFRYGYERGISFRGRAVAGEVEDHPLEIMRGGPTAVDDEFIVRRNSTDNQLNVLTNDTLRPGTGTVISSVGQPSAGGSVRIAPNGGSLLYTPQNGFTGTETFVYTLRDRDGLTDTASVSVFVQPDLATIRLAAARPDGTPITSVAVGETFLLQAYVQDLTPAGGGVFSAYLDIEYPAGAMEVAGPIVYGEDYPNGQSGSTTTPGLIDEVGALDGLDRLGSAEAFLFAVPMRALQTGTHSLTGNPAEVLPNHVVLLFDRDDPVPTNQIEYRSLTITFTQGAQQGAALTNPRNSLDVNDDTSVSPVDALLVINELNHVGALAARAEGEPPSYYPDVNGDGAVSPLDALLVINALNRLQDAEGEPASLAAVAAAVDSSAEDYSEVDFEGPMAPAVTTDDPQRRVVRSDAAAHQLLFAALADGDDEWMSQDEETKDDLLV